MKEIHPPQVPRKCCYCQWVHKRQLSLDEPVSCWRAGAANLPGGTRRQLTFHYQTEKKKRTPCTFFYQCVKADKKTTLLFPHKHVHHVGALTSTCGISCSGGRPSGWRWSCCRDRGQIVDRLALPLTTAHIDNFRQMLNHCKGVFVGFSLILQQDDKPWGLGFSPCLSGPITGQDFNSPIASGWTFFFTWFHIKS